jgi:hypothetical protein
MRNVILVAVVAVAVVLATAVAQAGIPRTLVGTVEPSGTVELSIAEGKPIGNHGPIHGSSQWFKLRSRVYRFKFTGVPLTCDDGTTTTYSFRGKSISPRIGGLGSFLAGGEGQLDSEHNAESWFILGLLQRPNLATGILKVETTDASGPGKVTCESGRLPWTASSPAD